jgi:hypothetical protein
LRLLYRLMVTTSLTDPETPGFGLAE